MNITKTFDAFNYEAISLASPVRTQGSGYYSKILLNNENNFYIQTPKCTTKNGIVETGKRTYCDLLLNNNNESFAKFIMNIETHIKKILQKKNSLWFENDMNDDDIDYFFNTNLKTYKQKYYLFRSFIAKSRTLSSLHNLQIYDDNDEEKTYNDVKDKETISIIHLKGVKFTSSSFNIDVELKQMMLFNDTPLFSKKLITIDNNDTKSQDNITLEKNTYISSDELDKDNDEEHNNDLELENNENEITDISTNQVTENVEAIDENKVATNNKEFENEYTTGEHDDPHKENLGITQNSEIEEYDISVDDNESITLKKPNEVYYEIYKKAKIKAKESKKQAIIDYLEAKNIKKTYMLEESDESSSDEEDFDNLSEISYENIE